MRVDLQSPNIFDAIIKSARYSHARKVLDGEFTITVNGAMVNFLDANGSNRDVNLPSLEEGLYYTIANVGAAGNLLVKDSGGNLISTVQPGQTVELWGSEEEWQGSKATSDLDVFTNTVNGLVPAPNSGTPGSLFLRDDGQWGQIQVVGIVDAFKYISDGTNIAVGAGPDTFTIWSPDGSLSVLVTNNEAVHGDNVRLEVDEANVDHNALQNYVADQHVAHSTIDVVAGYGLSGGGTIDASIALAFDDTELTIGTVPLTGYAVVAASTGGSGRMLWSDINTMLVHDDLTGYVANEHIDHSVVNVIAGVGLVGGGAITTSVTLNLAIDELPTDDTISAADLFAFYDDSEGDHGAATLTQVNAALDHNALLNYVLNEHINHSSVTISAGTGLTGGGDLTANRSLALDPVPATAALNIFTDVLKGLVPASGGGSSAFLRADGVFAVPPASAGPTTGDVLLTLKTTAPSGWVMMNDGTIGSATSGATYADALAEDLFIFMWDTFSNTLAPVSGGRGASAAADWAANKTIGMLKWLGRSLAVGGAGSGLTSRTHGSNAGSETETPTIAKTAQHDHVQQTFSGPAGIGALQIKGPWGHDGSHTGSTNVANAVEVNGSSNALNIVDPSIYLNVMVKL